MWNRQKGFTLIEILVVLSILTVLAGIVTLAITQFMGAGKTEALAYEKHIIADAVHAYVTDNYSLPTTGEVLYQKHYILNRPTLADYTVDINGDITQTPR